MGDPLTYLALNAPTNAVGILIMINLPATSQSTSPLRANPVKPLANPKHSVSNAEANAAPADDSGYSGPSKGNNKRKIGEKRAAPQFRRVDRPSRRGWRWEA